MTFTHYLPWYRNIPLLSHLPGNNSAHSAAGFIIYTVRSSFHQVPIWLARGAMLDEETCPRFQLITSWTFEPRHLCVCVLDVNNASIGGKHCLLCLAMPCVFQVRQKVAMRPWDEPVVFVRSTVVRAWVLTVFYAEDDVPQVLPALLLRDRAIRGHLHHSPANSTHSNVSNHIHTQTTGSFTLVPFSPQHQLHQVHATRSLCAQMYIRVRSKCKTLTLFLGAQTLQTKLSNVSDIGNLYFED